MSSKRKPAAAKRAHRKALIIIGGGEDKEGDKVILREVAARVGAGPLVVTTVASHEPEGLFEKYEKIFHELGVKQVQELEIETRCDAQKPENAARIRGARGVFFTGGDQLRIASQIGDTPISDAILSIYENGGVVAGTSAGASVMSDTMLVAGESRGSHRASDALRMAPGLGLMAHVVIDQHFSERGRFGRLIGAVSHNPQSLGLGIDEDTAVVVEGDRFRVIGSGAVYVLDGRSTTYSNVADATADETVSIYDVTVHVLSQGDAFDLEKRRPARVLEKPPG
jgi:cyanophycinase